jgi:hypothetical protein
VGWLTTGLSAAEAGVVDFAGSSAEVKANEAAARKTAPKVGMEKPLGRMWGREEGGRAIFWGNLEMSRLGSVL